MAIETLVVDKAASFILGLIGGATGALVISTFFNVWVSWRQVRELERQTELELIQAEAIVIVAEELRKR